MGKESAKDLFMNFASVVTFLATPTTTLATAKLGTALSIRGALGWLIHTIQWWLTDDLPDVPWWGTVWGALSTKSGLATVPGANESGCIDAAYLAALHHTTGGNIIELGAPRPFAPPIPLAAPEIHVYAQMDNGVIAMQGNKVVARIGYTTTPMTGNLWQEVAEVWGW